jgi:hypothetical protein
MVSITEFERLGDGMRPESVGYRLKSFFSLGPHDQEKNRQLLEKHIKEKCRTVYGIASYEIERHRAGNDMTWLVTFKWRNDVERFTFCPPGYFAYHGSDGQKLPARSKLRVIVNRKIAASFRLLNAGL